MHRPTSFALASALIFTTSLAMAAPTPAQRKKANEVNRLSQQGLRKLPNNFRNNYEKRKTDLEAAAKILEQIKPLWTSDLAAISSFSGPKRYFEQLLHGVEQGRYALACLEAKTHVQAFMRKKQDVPPEALAALDKAAATFVKNARPERKRHAKYWDGEAKAMRAGAAQATASRTDAANKAQAKANYESQNDALDELFETLERWKLAAKNQESISESELAAFDAGIKRVEAFNPQAKAYFSDEKLTYELYRAFRKKGGESQVAKLLSGRVAAKGKVKGKRAKLSFKTKKDHCYVVFGGWQSERGDTDIWWKNQNTHTQVQKFNFVETWSWLSRQTGACTTKAMKLTMGGYANARGSNNGLKYVVVEWPKAKFPLFVAAQIKLALMDACDPKQFYERWANPVPGIIAYEGSDALMLGKLRIVLSSRATGREKGNETKYSSQAPKSAKLPEYRFGVCNAPENSGDKLAVKYGRCKNKVYAQFEPKLSKARKRRDTARSPSVYKAARSRIRSLESKRRSTIDKRCEPTRKKIIVRMKKQEDRLADLFSRKPYQGALDVVGHLVAREEAAKRPLMPNGKPETRSDADLRRSRRKRMKQARR